MANMNTSAAEATVIPYLPYTITVAPDSPTQKLWWTVTPEDCDLVMGVRPWTADATYAIRMEALEGSDTDNLETIADGQILYPGVKPTYFPVKPFVPVYISIEDTTTGTASGTLVLTVDRAPRRAISSGDVVVADDSPGFHAVVLSKTNGSVVRYLPVVPGEDGTSAGDSMLSSHTWETETILYNRTAGNILASFPIGPINCVTQNRRDTYYVAVSTTFYKIDHGVMTTMPYSLPFSNIAGMAVDEALDKLYYVRSNTVRSLTLSTGAGDALALAAIGGMTNSGDLVRLHDGSVYVGYRSASANYLKRYNPSSAWAVLGTVTLGATEEINHITGDINPYRIWVWTEPDSAYGRFFHVDGLAGTVLNQWDSPTYSAGNYQGTGAATTPIFGHSYSCTFWVVPADCDICGCECTCEPGAQTPPTKPITGMSGENEGDDPTRELNPSTTVCDFGGTVPTGTNGTDTEDWSV